MYLWYIAFSKTHLQETHRSIDRLRETIRHQEDELQRLRQENMEIRTSHQDSANSVETFERAIIDEINEECRRTAQVLGISPRTVSITGWEVLQCLLNHQILIKNMLVVDIWIYL